MNQVCRFFPHNIRACLAAVFALSGLLAAPRACAAEPLALGGRRELFVDSYLIASKTNVQLTLHEPRDEGMVLKFDAPTEGPFCGYVTVIQESNRFRVYYRGKDAAGRDGENELTCVAESPDGRDWTRPNLDFIATKAGKGNNVILSEPPFAHNFSPFRDSNPKTPAEQKYKAIAGYQNSGLKAFASPDGLRWQAMQDKPVLTTNDVPFKYVFDSQNVAFWSAAENRYLLYFRVYKDKMRRIARAESTNFLNWEKVHLMEYRGADGRPAPVEELYINQTHPYFRAPQIYVSLAARFMLGRQVLTTDEAKAIGVHPSYFKDVSDAVFMTSRGGNIYDRTFMGAFIKPGIGAENWVSRTTYPALNVVQTGTNEMSIYVNQSYAQPTAHLRRYSMRLDGFSSLRAPHEGGEFVTKPIKFCGSRLLMNFSTSAAGGIKIEILDEAGKPIPGYTFADSVESIGNEIERAARWKSGTDVGKLAGQPVQLHFKIKDADLFAIRFAEQM